MKERFVKAFDKALSKNLNGEIENVLITDDNTEFLANARDELRKWSERRGFNLVELDEKDESLLAKIASGELLCQLNLSKTVLLVENYATISLNTTGRNIPRTFLHNVAVNRSCICNKESDTICELSNLLFVVAINDLSEMKWRADEYFLFQILHEDEEKRAWVASGFICPDSKMHPVMSRENKTLYFVSDDMTTLCFDVMSAFRGKLKRPISRYSTKECTDFIHSHLESNLPYFCEQVECLLLKNGGVDISERFVLDGDRLLELFPKLGSVCCVETVEVSNTNDKIYTLDPFELGELCFYLTQDGDVDMANTLVRDLWALDFKWARFFRRVARDYYRKPEDHVKADPDNTVHAPTGMDQLFHIYWLGWYHTGDDFFDEEDKVYSIFHENFNKAVDLLPARFQNCSVDEVAEKLYWDIQYAENDDRPGYFNFEKILREAERLCPGVQDKMCENGWLTQDEGYYYITKRCNMCGKSFTFWDNQENFCLDHRVGFGSSYDLHRIRLNLCCNCFDKVMDWIHPQCMHNPVSEYQ